MATALVLALATHGACADDAAGALVVVVSASNPVRALSQNQVADIFLGRSGQFPDGRRAVPVDQTDGSPIREAFTTRILERTPAQVRAHWARIIFTGRGRPPRNAGGDEAVKQAIAGDPHAISYIDRALVDASVAVVAIE